MNFSTLGYDELRQLCRWLDWAEHHAQYEYEHADCSGKNAWHTELRYLCQTESEMRTLTNEAKAKT